MAPLGAFRVSVFEIQAINSSNFFDKEYLAAFGRAQASLALLLLARYFLSFLYFRENGRLNISLNCKNQNKTKSSEDDHLNHTSKQTTIKNRTKWTRTK